MNLKENEIKILQTYRDFKRKRTKAILHNIGEDMKILALFVIGIPLAIIFYLAQLRVLSVVLSINPIITATVNVSLIFLYGCILHDLMIPYLRRNYMKVPN